ncbi:hypothetical protein JS528_01130 [Bifidobacterium sp. MA2]|uniref:C4-dicarboxylate ABC transporter n=1 Tax=Bifidobacterium santillanense TaxID=2809028 RepID=A0ABS5UM53_9BIFI|nr:hypothetical protein [Bifidobacterium santillanense]MBT1171983.1 hypothetical protein [Bifidobacterium santillanense]
MLDIVPAVLWCVAVVMSLNIIGLCVLRGRLLTRYAGGVPRVSWPVTIMNVVSALLGLSPYLVYTWFADTGAFDPDVRDWYASYGWPSAGVVIVLLIVQLACLYAQARRAMRSEMDAKLSSAIR